MAQRREDNPSTGRIELFSSHIPYVAPKIDLRNESVRKLLEKKKKDQSKKI